MVWPTPGKEREIERFREAITSDKTFEIRGDNSIHIILEHFMWIVDERY